MRAILIRTGSVPDLLPVQHHSFVSGSPRVSLSVHDFIAKNGSASPKFSLHLEAGRRRNSPPATGIRRASSETELIRSESRSSSLTGAGSRSFPARIPEQEYVGDWTQSGVAVEELGFPGGGIGKGRNSGSNGGGGDDWNIGNFTGGNADRSRIGAYYQEMLKSDPNNSLLLRNYGRFLHEVEGDVVKAEECYGRAILSSPGDGELLALYGKLIWENERDGDRAKCYFDQAVHSSPNDCMVMGSYAQFMWEAEDEDGGDGRWEREVDHAAAVVEVF